MKGIKIEHTYQDSVTGDEYVAHPDKKKGKQNKGKLVKKGVVKSSK